MLFKQREVYLAKYWSSPFFGGLWTEPQARSINLQKKKTQNETNRAICMKK